MTKNIKSVVGATIVVLMLIAACGEEESGDALNVEGPSADELASLPEDVRTAAEWASANDMLFVTSHEEIVKRAEEIGSLRILRDLDDAFAEGFSKAYPNVDVYVEHAFTGADTYQRFLLEYESGVVDNWDVAYAPPDYYTEFAELMAPWDILGMSESGILDIPEKMIDPERRNVVAVASQAAGMAYNADAISETDMPQSWEDLLDEKYRGIFSQDVRPQNIAPLVPLWGLERTKELTAGLAELEPIWATGQTDALTRVAAGETAMHVFTNHNVAVRVQERYPDSAMMTYLLDPVPVILSETLGVHMNDISQNPYGALLFIEWMAGPEGQRILDEDPLKSSIFAEGSEVARLLEGREVAVSEFRYREEIAAAYPELIEAMGFPQARD